VQAATGAGGSAPEASPTTSAPPPESARRPVCVLLLAPGEVSPPEDLLAALSRRGLRPVPAATPFRAMAQLASRAAESPDGATRAGALIIVEPARQAARLLDDLIHSLDRYLPGAAVWAYERGAEQRLHRLERDPEPDIVVREQEARASMRNGAAGSGGEPSLRLRRDEEDASIEDAPPTDDDSRELDDSDTQADSGDLLSQEEISMLMREDDEDEHGGRAPGRDRP